MNTELITDFWLGRRCVIVGNEARQGTVVAVNHENMVVCIRWDDDLTHSTADMVSVKIIQSSMVEVGSVEPVIADAPVRRNCWTCKYNDENQNNACVAPFPADDAAHVKHRTWIRENVNHDCTTNMPPRTADGCPEWSDCLR